MTKANDFKKTQYKNEDLKAAIDRLREMCGDDDELLADMVEGETDLDQFLERLVLEILQSKMSAKGTAAIISDMQLRKKRFETRADSLTGMIYTLLNRCNIRSIETPSATLSIKTTAKQLVITEESDINSKFFKRSDPTLDRTALKKALTDRIKAIETASKMKEPEAREAAMKAANIEHPEIKGAGLDNGGETLQLRVL